MKRIGIFMALAASGCSAKNQYNADRCPWVNLERSTAIRNGGNIDFAQAVKNQEACLAGWGFKLSNAPGSAREIAAATVAGCEETIDLYARALFQFKNPDTGTAFTPDGDLAAARSAASRQALFYVVAGRAGHCDQKPK